MAGKTRFKYYSRTSGDNKYIKWRRGVHLVVEVVVVVSTGGSISPSGILGFSWELEVRPETTLLLECRGEHLVPGNGLVLEEDGQLDSLSDVIVGDRAPGKLHGLLEVGAGNLRHGVAVLVLHQLLPSTTAFLLLLLLSDLLLDALTNSQFTGTLADLRDISSREADSALRQEGHVHVGGYGCLAEIGLEDLETRGFIGQGNVDELVETARTKHGRVDDVRSE